MRLLNSTPDIYIYSVKKCHKCNHTLLLPRNMTRPEKNPHFLKCEKCGYNQPIYDR